MHRSPSTRVDTFGSGSLADEVNAEIVANRLVEHLERSGFVVMQKPQIGGAATLGRGHDST